MGRSRLGPQWSSWRDARIERIRHDATEMTPATRVSEPTGGPTGRPRLPIGRNETHGAWPTNDVARPVLSSPCIAATSALPGTWGIRGGARNECGEHTDGARRLEEA